MAPCRNNDVTAGRLTKGPMRGYKPRQGGLGPYRIAQEEPAMHLLKWVSRRALIVAVATIVSLAVGVTPAYAASWQIVITPNPTGNDGFATLTEITPANLWAVGSATS